MQQSRQAVEVHATAFVQGDEQRLLRRADVFTERTVVLVERPSGRDEQHQAAGSYFLQRGREKVIVDEEVPRLETRVERFVVAERDIRDGHVVEPIGQLRFLEGLVANVGVGVEHSRQAGGKGVDFDARDARAPVHLVGHQADEMTQAEGGFEDPSVRKAEAPQHRVYRADDSRRGVVRVERGGARRFEFVRGQELFQHAEKVLRARFRDQHISDDVEGMILGGANPALLIFRLFEFGDFAEDRLPTALVDRGIGNRQIGAGNLQINLRIGLGLIFGV